VLGDRWQLGGTLVIDEQGGIVYRHVSEVAGDHGSVSDVLFALRRLQEAAGEKGEQPTPTAAPD
jgi:hypothetical protein